MKKNKKDMTKNASVSWIDNFKCEGKTDSGQTVIMDTGENAVAASPAELILQALAGCTMMDCILIFNKARKNLKRFWVDIEAEEAEEIPKVFKRIHIKYNIVSDNITENDALRAIKLSEDKYCRVHSMLHGNVKITSSFEIKSIN